MAVTLLGDPIHLEQGGIYRGIVGGSEGLFWVSRGAVRDGFEDLGFANVRAEFEPFDSWPADQTIPAPAEGWRAYVQGTWAKPTTDVSRATAHRVRRAWKHADAPPGTYAAPPQTSRGPPALLLLVALVAAGLLLDCSPAAPCPACICACPPSAVVVVAPPVPQ